MTLFLNTSLSFKWFYSLKILAYFKGMTYYLYMAIPHSQAMFKHHHKDPSINSFPKHPFPIVKHHAFPEFRGSLVVFCPFICFSSLCVGVKLSPNCHSSPYFTEYDHIKLHPFCLREHNFIQFSSREDYDTSKRVKSYITVRI